MSEISNNSTVIDIKPQAVLNMAKVIMGDLQMMQVKTEELKKAYQQLGQSYEDSGYTELGNTLNTITTQIGDKTGQIALITQQLVIFAGKLNEALKKQSANQTQEG